MFSINSNSIEFCQNNSSIKLCLKNFASFLAVETVIKGSMYWIFFFIKELERVSSKGYIELPTPLEDNLVFENKNDHIWHLEFNDIENKLLIKKKFNT